VELDMIPDGSCADELQIVEPIKICADEETVPVGKNGVT